MKNADDWVKDAMLHIESCWHTHYHSEMVGELEAAVAAFDEALALRPDHFDALYEKGLALVRLERYEHAAATFAQAQRLRPEIAELRRQLDDLSSRLERREEAQGAKELAKAQEKAAAPAMTKSEPRLRCPTCRSDRIALGSAPEIYELKCESCGHSEIFDIMSPERESDSHWLA
jgi:tetratricopeptide (TPR) repeat protein